MQTKTEVYAEHIEPLVRRIFEICAEHQIAYVQAFCIDMSDKEDGKKEMTLAGGANLGEDTQAPQPLILAATMLRVPGFSPIPEPDGQVH